MAKLNRWLMIASAVALVGLGTTSYAQDNNNNNNRGGRGNFDPAQMQQRMMDGIKERLEVKDETEWKAMQPLVQKVMDLQRSNMGDRMRGFFRRPGGDNNNNGGDQNRGRGGMFGTASPEADALQRAIDGKASVSELKAAMTRFTEARAKRQAEVEKAQLDLRKVLTARQEAIATASGLL